MATRAPKQWCLTKHENLNSFANWKHNFTYTLSLHKKLSLRPFLAEGSRWLKKTQTSSRRGLVADGENIPEAQRLTAQQKVKYLELMLESISQVIRLHFGCQTNEARNSKNVILFFSGNILSLFLFCKNICKQY